MNLGLRWEYGSPYYERDNKITNFDPATASLVTAKAGGVYDRSTMDPDYNDFAPRIGFAYAVDRNTSVRGGYGVGYILSSYSHAGPAP